MNEIKTKYGEKIDNAGVVALINSSVVNGSPLESRQYGDFVQLKNWVAQAVTKEVVSANCTKVKAVKISNQWVPFAFLRVNRAGDLFVPLKIAREKFGYVERVKDCVDGMEELEK
jgi:hypothetical protein